MFLLAGFLVRQMGYQEIAAAFRKVK